MLDRPPGAALLLPRLPLWRNGRRGGLKIRGRKAWEFESPRGHQNDAGQGDPILHPEPEAATDAAARTGFAGGLETFLGPRCVLGWAADPLAPESPVTLVVRLRGVEQARITTGGHDRPDLFATVGPAKGLLFDLPESYQPGDLATGRLALHPLRAESEHPPLPVRPRLAAQEQAAAGHAMLLRAEATLGAEGLTEMLALLGRADGFGAARLAGQANAELAAGLRGARPRQAALSTLNVPVGTRSADGAVVVGHDGHLFLLTGSNGEIARLGADPAQCDRLVAAWMAVFAARRARARALGIRFVQLIVPEKTSLLRRMLPDPGKGGPSPFLAALDAAVAADGAAADVLMGQEILEVAAEEDDLPLAAMLRRLDSHPSAAGMHALAQAVLRHLGHDPPDLGRRFQLGQIAGGDLAGRFEPLPVFEEIDLAQPRVFARFGVEPALVAESVPPDGGHIGRTEHWRAAGAPSRRRLMAFGNSVCGTGHAGQGLLSGWLARWFAEYRFHWQPEVDWAAVAAARPDILLCQTVERFMGRVPEA